MGTVHRVTCSQRLPDWPEVLARITAHNVVAEMRMIDGQLAFPDEIPPSDWTELRVSIDGWMVTIRRAENSVEFVTWSDATPELQAAVAVLADAFQG
jgi:hypothetical protein